MKTSANPSYRIAPDYGDAQYISCLTIVPYDTVQLNGICPYQRIIAIFTKTTYNK